MGRRRASATRLLGRALLLPFALLRDAAMRRLSIASFIYSGMQLCFIAFMTVHLTTVAGFDLIGAGRALGGLPDHRRGQPADLGLGRRPVPDAWADAGGARLRHGAGAAWRPASSGRIGRAGRCRCCCVAGATAGGYTGIAYAEYAHLGGARRTEATGLGTALMFFGVL